MVACRGLEIIEIRPSQRGEGFMLENGCEMPESGLLGSKRSVRIELKTSFSFVERNYGT